MEDRPITRTSIEDISARILRSWWFLGLISAAVIALLALASLPWCFNRFVLKATTHIVEISASAPSVHPIGLNLPRNSEIQIFNAQSDNLPPELTTLAAATISVRLLASGATLQSISLPNEAGLVVLTTSDGRTDLGVLNGGSVSLALSGTIERIDETGHHTTIANVARAIAWDITTTKGQSPARLVLPPGVAQVALYNQPINNFRFAPPRSPGDNPLTFQSEILKGELQLLDTGTPVELRPRELVLLEGGRWFLSRLEVIDNAIAVDMLGEADRISVGPPRPGGPFRLDRDLTPSVLSYLVGQHQLKLLWGGALAVLATLWKARQWAVKWGK